MPVLPNPRHEAFAQAIVKGLASDKPNGKNTQKAAYLAAGYSPATIEAADAAASKLLRKVKSILDRVQELQAQALARLNPKLDISRERIGRRLDMASRTAEDERDVGNIVSSELGLAKVFGLAKHDDSYDPTDYSHAKSPVILAGCYCSLWG
jgi:hypothetical protein